MTRRTLSAIVGDGREVRKPVIPEASAPWKVRH